VPVDVWSQHSIGDGLFAFVAIAPQLESFSAFSFHWVNHNIGSNGAEHGTAANRLELIYHACDALRSRSAAFDSFGPTSLPWEHSPEG